MPWQCTLLNIVGEKYFDLPRTPDNPIVGETRLMDAYGKSHSIRDLPIGTMFYVPKNADMDEWPWYLADKEYLSDYYKKNNSHRQPLFVILPKHTLYLIDGKCFDNGKAYGGWIVTGFAPLITVQPSIDFKGTYHGFLQNGVISDDVEGRIFDR